MRGRPPAGGDYLAASVASGAFCRMHAPMWERVPEQAAEAARKFYSPFLPVFFFVFLHVRILRRRLAVFFEELRFFNSAVSRVDPFQFHVEAPHVAEVEEVFH